MKQHLIALAILLVCSMAPGSLFAQQWPELSDVPPVEKVGQSDTAVIVAIEDYAFLPDIPGATKNAADWERFLSDGLGIETVLVLTNQQAVREEILTFAERAAANATEGSTLWFVFIGHGAPNSSGDDGLLIGADGQQNTKSMTSRGVAQRELMAALEQGEQSKTVVLLDACFSGRDASGDALAKGTMPVLPVDTAPPVASTTVVMTAARADEFAGDLPGADRPAFSYLVLGAMRGWADDGDGNVSAEGAVAFARRELLNISGRQQTPQLVGGKSVLLTTGVAEARPDFGPNSRTTSDGASTADEPPVSATAGTDALVANPAWTDGVPDNPFYVFGAIGPGAIDNFGTLALTGDFGAGVKFNGFTGGPNEWRFGLRLGLGSHANDDAPDVGDFVNGGEVFSDDEIRDTRIFTWVVGPELARAWRSESGPGLWGDAVFMVSVMGLYGNQPNACTVWKVETDGTRSDVECDRDSVSTASGPGGGLSAAANIGPVRISAQLAYLIDIDVFAAVTAGLTFDI